MVNDRLILYNVRIDGKIENISVQKKFEYKNVTYMVYFTGEKDSKGQEVYSVGKVINESENIEKVVDKEKLKEINKFLQNKK